MANDSKESLSAKIARSIQGSSLQHSDHAYRNTSRASRQSAKSTQPSQSLKREHDSALESRTNKRARFQQPREVKSAKHGRSARHSTTTKKQESQDESHDELALPVKSARRDVRDEISNSTVPKREAFILAYAEYFLPLLPERNSIVKLRTTGKGQQVLAVSEQVEQPGNVMAVMKPYQVEGLNFLIKMYRNGMPAILGDEMGLGKTLQTLALFQWLEDNQPVTGERRPYLVVCPLSVLASWLHEAKKWTPRLVVHRMHGTKSERAMLRQKLLVSTTQVNLVVTTYEAFIAEQNWFKRSFVWRYVVLDEGHKIKNEQTALAHSLQSLSAEYRLLVTGTPLQNNMVEAWALLHWLLPEVFTIDTQLLFKRAFELTKGSVSTVMMGNLRRLLEIIMLRRMKSSPGVDLGIPPKEEVTLFVPLTPLQREWYLKLLTRIDQATLKDVFGNARAKESSALLQQGSFMPTSGAKAVSEQDNGVIDPDEINHDPNRWKKLQNLVMQLRKVCSHPYMIPGADSSSDESPDGVRQASGKFMVLDKLVDELVVRKKKKILIFSGFTKTLDLVEELLLLKGAKSPGGPFRFTRLDGGVHRARRNVEIRMFNDPSTDFRVMLISTRAGGLGINLTAASDVVFMDQDWNAQVMLQAEARAHRIGQTKNVTVYKLCTRSTVEEQMMGRIQKKLYLSIKVTESMRNLHTTGQSYHVDGEEIDDETQLGGSQLKSLLRRGAQVLAGPEVSIEEISRWDWATVLEKCKNVPLSTDETEVDETAWLNQIEKVETAIFEGKKWQRHKNNEAAPILDLNRADRRNGKNTTVMVDGFAIDKTSVLCADWEAVPTLAGKDPRLAEPKRAKRAAIRNQDHCQVCWNGGTLVTCAGCPRSYHTQCLEPEARQKVLGMAF